MDKLTLFNTITFGFLFTAWSKKGMVNIIIKLALLTLVILNVVRLVKGV